MVKRVHFFDSAKNGAACGVMPQKTYRKSADNPNQCRSLKSTTQPENVTCTRCKEYIARQINHFVCPHCKQYSNHFILVENVCEKSTVQVCRKSRRTHRQVLERKLISIICPICNKELPATQNWHDTNIELRH